MVERESKVKTKANTKKKLLIAAGVVVVALAVALVFISNYLTADDGLTLHGVYYANAETADTHRWALVLHGYRGDYTGALQLAAPYYEAGYQVIAPDLRACGESEGDYVGMGWLDR